MGDSSELFTDDIIILKGRPSFSGYICVMGFAVFLLGIYLISLLSVYTVLLGVLLFLISIPLILLLYGIKIDFKNKRVFPFASFIIFKAGKWHSTKRYEKIVLIRVNDGNVNHYEIYMEDGETSLFIRDFVDYQNAWKFLEECAVKLEMKSEDKVQNERKRSKKYRKPYWQRNR